MLTLKKFSSLLMSQLPKSTIIAGFGEHYTTKQQCYSPMVLILLTKFSRFSDSKLLKKFLKEDSLGNNRDKPPHWNNFQRETLFYEVEKCLVL